ncbi:phage tail protein [Streptomyces sp. S.PNR 29]|uniref:phage tail protein n=1 Tax=Streptomyces sp. S.PNR 29 TaxID=2973805 RepID=UPI0025B0BB38|nr:phage tail protein [Streptomyces sp. S.PNR 29]MDN0198349.1 phage tail protein [Streptomyces sp. S.PNR 29]
MSRAAVPGLPSRYPIGEQLPALYADDDFAQRFTAGLDVVLAPVFATLDNLHAYLDPRVTPTDFLAWLASWVGAAHDPHRPAELRRDAVVRAVELHRWRGTGYGLVEGLRLALGVHAEVTGDGGAAWSRTAGADLPPELPDETLVRVWPGRAGRVDEDRVREIVRAMCPVHTVCRVEVLPGPPADEGR